VLPPPAAPGRHAAFADDGRLLALVDQDETGRIRILRGFNLPPG
jgi:tRNA pseudouridine55 synthase